MELVAPGQQIVSTGAFGGVCVVGGTSLAAPHVTAVASVLWQKDRSVSADFIRSLLAFTANQYGEDYEYGNGLVDLEFALSQFDAFREVYAVDADVLNEQVGAAVEDGTLDVNEKPVEEFEGVVYVEGSWAPDQHNKFPELNGISGILTGDKLALVKLGAIAPDSILPAMKRHSEWHGYIRHVANGEDILWYSNYVFTYIFVSEIAKGVAEGKSPTSVNNSLSVKCIDNSTCPKGDFCGAAMLMEIREQFCNGGIITEDDFGNLTGQKSWSELFNNKYQVNNENISYYIYGLSMHILTDTFAHSSYKLQNGKWKRIIHDDGADKVTVVPNRLKCASFMSRSLIDHIIRKESGSVDDFYKFTSSSIYDGSFKLGNLAEYIKAIDEVFYNSHKDKLNNASNFEPI